MIEEGDTPTQEDPPVQEDPPTREYTPTQGDKPVQSNRVRDHALARMDVYELRMSILCDTRDIIASVLRESMSRLERTEAEGTVPTLLSAASEYGVDKAKEMLDGVNARFFKTAAKYTHYRVLANMCDRFALGQEEEKH